jgi:hypothetical protein
MPDYDPSRPYSYSVSFRLQRETTEVAFVSVPVTEDLKIAQPDGTGRIDGAKMIERAVELGKLPKLRGCRRVSRSDRNDSSAASINSRFKLTHHQLRADGWQ